MILRYISLLLLIFALGTASHAKDFMLGVDANFSLEMETNGLRWKWSEQEQDLFAGMQEHGVRWLRVRLWTNDDGINGKQYATRIVERSGRAGLTPYLVIFLSDNWADLNKQPVPAVWRNLSFDERIDAVRRYSRGMVNHFQKNGLTSHVYEIGNEIDYGICGVYPGKRSKKDPATLSQTVWPAAAKLIRAAQEGVREADRDARFLLHIAHWWDADFCTAFFKFMTEQGVQIDYAGLSYFPSSNIGGSLTLDQFGAVVDRLHSQIDRPVIVAEMAYPATADFGGQFGNWRKEVPGYPLTLEGQRKWLTDFLRFCINHPAIQGAFYWSPEWYGPGSPRRVFDPTATDGMWKAFALFDDHGDARPAWSAFGALESPGPPNGSPSRR